MATESVTLELDEAAARILKEASPEQRRSLEALVSLHLLEAATSRQSLRELMDIVGKQADARGLTEEHLQDLLRAAEDARATRQFAAHSMKLGQSGYRGKTG